MKLETFFLALRMFTLPESFRFQIGADKSHVNTHRSQAIYLR